MGRCKLLMDVILTTMSLLIFSLLIWLASVCIVVFGGDISNQEALGSQKWTTFLVRFGLILINILFSAYWLWSLVGHDFNRQEHHTDSSRIVGRVAKRDLPKPAVTPFVLRDSMTEYTGSVCTICLEEFSSGGILGRLPCEHVFHDKCVRTWLKSRRRAARCPMRCPIAARSSRNLHHCESLATVLGSESD